MTHSLKIDCHGPAAFRRLCVETNQPAHTGVSNGGQPPSGGCVLKPKYEWDYLFGKWPAAFRRLCVETKDLAVSVGLVEQPPSGGCVLKLEHILNCRQSYGQPPSGGCVLKHFHPVHRLRGFGQPPSGGCVLKHFHPVHRLRGFGQPPSGGCVLKLNLRTPLMPAFTAAFRRLCVETVMYSSGSPLLLQPPSGGCVLKQQPHPRCYLPKRSAAFRRLCVET